MDSVTQPPLTLTSTDRKLHADLLYQNPPTDNPTALHYDVTRQGEIVGRLSKRIDGTNPSPGWWVWAAEDNATLKHGYTTRYFPRPQFALDALATHLRDTISALLNPAHPTKTDPMPTPTCTVPTCPANVLNPSTLHKTGDNECGYLNAADGPLLKHASDPYTCRRPYCARTAFTQEARDKHEADPNHPNHQHPDTMTFLCDWDGHATAISEQRLCPVCQ